MNIRQFTIYAVGIAAGLSSCADTDMIQMQMEEPTSLAETDYLRQYDVLKNYTSHVGVNITPETLAEAGMEYRTAVANFTELVPGDAFLHQRMVKANGSIDTTRVAKAKSVAKRHGLALVGGPLVWHSAQNATYLNERLSPNVIRPEGDEGGYCLKMTNTAVLGAYDKAQVAYTFAKTPQVESGIKYRLRLMVRGTAEGEVQCATYSNGKGSRFTPTFKVTKDWTQVEMTNSMASGIRGLQAVLFNLGQYVGTLYVDDIELVEIDNKGNAVTSNLNTVNANLDDEEKTAESIAIHNNGDSSLEDVGVSALGEGYDPLATYVEKTPEEKAAICLSEMTRYISSAMQAGGQATAEWVVVNEPFAEDTGNATEFRWQDYLGSDYALQAFTHAAQCRPDARLYLGESDIANCQRLVTLANELEARGACVDGFALTLAIDSTQMSKPLYDAAFATLAKTGKKVKITDLKSDHHQAYDAVLAAYADNVPLEQRAGVVQHQIADAPDSPFGLWDQNYDRKRAYGSFVEKLREN